MFFSLMSTTMAMTNVTEKKSAFVHDDGNQIRRMRKRRLVPFFEKVFTAGGSQEATQILEEHDVSHIQFDFNLDLGASAGTEDATSYLFVPLWRRELPNIDRAVVFTSGDVGSRKRPEAVDTVLYKADRPRAAAAFFDDWESPK